jgi:hypothetical protein
MSMGDGVILCGGDAISYNKCLFSGLSIRMMCSINSEAV